MSTKADELFDAITKHDVLESAMVDALLTACGVELRKADQLPVGDVTFDPYDSSFEFKSTAVGFMPTDDQLAACWALGFHRCWICYVEGTETALCSPALLAAVSPPAADAPLAAGAGGRPKVDNTNT